MAVTFTPAVRRNTHILMALAGASGSGKTYSALELATGLAGPDGKIAVIDTEAGRALHYADQFKFDHCDMGPPFTPTRYREIIEAAEEAGYAVIVVDSFSHEHSGTGGLLEMAEAELLKPNMKSPANWAVPKSQHKRMMNRLLQCRAHIILALRAEEKIRIEKIMDERSGRERTVVVPAGWIAITEKTTMFEMVVSFVMSPERPGVPIEGSGKIQDQHRFAFPAGKLVSRQAGEALAKWAAGGSAPRETASHTQAETAATTPAVNSSIAAAGEAAAKGGSASFTAWWNSAQTKPHRDGLRDRLAGWRDIVQAADRAAEQPSDEQDETPFADPERAAADDPASKPSRETSEAGSASEANVRQYVPAEGERPRTAPDLPANPVSHGEAGGSPAPTTRDPGLDSGNLTIAPPQRSGRPDWPAWSQLFFTKTSLCVDGSDLALIIGHNQPNIDAFKAALGPIEAQHFDGAIAQLYRKLP